MLNPNVKEKEKHLKCWFQVTPIRHTFPLSRPLSFFCQIAAVQKKV